MYTTKQKSRKKAFSMIEISIVIAIIAILVSTISIGSSVATRLKSQAIWSEIFSFEVSIRQFVTQYKQLPGDYDLADRRFSGSYSGNGNSKLDVQYNGIHESMLAWDHLYNARLFSQKLTPVTYGSAWEFGVNIPESSVLKKSGYAIGNDLNIFAIYGNELYKSFNDVCIILSRKSDNQSWNTYFGSSGGISPEVLEMIDIKYDDGMPFTGLINGYDISDSLTKCNTTTANFDKNAKYVQNESRDCMMFFIVKNLLN